MAATYKANYTGIGKMLTSDEMRAEMERRANAVAAVAKAIAPVDEDGPHPGRYREGIHVTTYVRRRPAQFGGHVGTRVVARVSVDDAGAGEAYEAFVVEYGTGRQEANHVLGRALDAARD